MNTLAIALAILLAMVLGVAASVFGFLWTLANANRIRRRFHINLGPYHACVLDFVSRKFPDLFWERSHRASWLKGVKWDAFNQRVWGYVDQHSAVQGQTVRVFLSADLDLARVEGQLIAFHFRGLGNEQEVWRSEVDTVRFQTLNHGAASIGTSWTPWCSLRVGEDWKSGFYRFDFIESNGKTTQDVAYLVVRNAAMSGDILVKIPTATYQAYNNFGGHSVYNNHHTGKGEGRAGQIISFDRPTPITRFRWYDQYFIHWIEQFAAEQGKTVDYATNYDVHADPAISATYPLMIMTGHDEYWSKEEFDNVYRRIFELGKNTMFLAANTAFWQIRYADAHQTDAGGRYERQFVCYKSTLDPVQYRFPAGQEKLASQYLSTRFRDNERRPEVMMLGVAYGRLYDGAWNRKFRYHVADNSLPFFANTGYQTGDFVADIIGHEWDARQPHWPDSDCERMWHEERSCIPFLPLEDIKVVLTGTARGKDGVDRMAEAVYFESRAGAKVFSAGTIAWALGLSKPGTEQSSFRQLNRNLMLYFLDSLVTESTG